MKELAWGASLGFGAGVAPGPLLALLLSSTLRGGLSAGARVAVAPVISDLPVVVLSMTALAALPGRVTAAMAFAGATFIVWLAAITLRDARTAVLSASPKPVPALRQAAIVNLLNPHPWLFWISVGAPLLLTAWADGPWPALAFLTAFYGVFIASKLTIAYLVARARGHINQTWYRRLLAIAAFLLAGTATALYIEFIPHLS